MKQKRVFRYFKPGDLTGMETAFNTMSREGWQVTRPGRFVQVYRQEAGACLHRLGCCTHRPGSAGEITWLAAQERAGWSVAARKGIWVLFRRPAEGAPEDASLEGHRDSVKAVFDKRIARMESFRRWMLVLASVLLLGGYASDLLPVLYSTALPLLGALFVTYRIKFLEEGLRR